MKFNERLCLLPIKPNEIDSFLKHWTELVKDIIPEMSRISYSTVTNDDGIFLIVESTKPISKENIKFLSNFSSGFVSGWNAHEKFILGPTQYEKLVIKFQDGKR